MKKAISLILAAAFALALLAGCAGTTVVINNCSCSQSGGSDTSVSTEPPVTLTEGSVKTGLAVVASASGAVEFDVTYVAVTVDEEGIIHSCVIDGLSASVSIDEAGAITSDLTAALSTKNELGSDYGMIAWGGAVAEWNQQAAALASYAVGKTVQELKSGAIDETGYAPDGSDLSSSATIYLGGYVSAIEKAVANAAYLGAESGDSLKLVTVNSLAESTSAANDTNGTAQLDSNVAAVTVKDGVITSCVIDSLQAQVSFDAAGTVAEIPEFSTKNELGDSYGMVAWGGASAEWYQQAASFAAYVVGKTAQEVASIAVTESTAPADGTDLAASVTIAIGGFQALIAKAMQ